MTIRRIPEDFRVEEQPTPGVIADRGDFAVLRLTKTSQTTPDAVARVAGLLGLPSASISYAGLKDKHAVTTQLISVEGLATPTRVEHKGLVAEPVGRADRPADSSWIACNRFTIVVRDLTDRDTREMGRRASLLKKDGLLHVVNYFGEQRFAAAKNRDHLAGRLLVRNDAEGALKLLIGTPQRKDSGRRHELTRVLAEYWGDWKKALKKLPGMPERAAVEALAAGATFAAAIGELPYLDRQMAVESYQSYLWNEIASGLAGELPNCLVVKTDFGELRFPPARAITDDLAPLQIPTPAHSSRPDFSPRWASHARRVLEAEQLPSAGPRLPADLKGKCPDFGAADRPFIITARAFEMSKPEPDDLGRSGRLKRTLTFELPRGSYATVLLRALGE